LNELSYVFSAKRRGMAVKNRRASSGLVNSGTNRTVAKRFTSFAYSSFVPEERAEGYGSS
jgi:hypothetical protein